MNEFIVWDKENYFGEDNRFHKLDRFLDEGLSVHYEKDNGLVIIDCDNDGDYSSPKVLNIETFNYIGKTDIKENKIYADCTIVELVDSKSRGIFFFDEKYLKFKFAFNGDKTTSLGMESFEKTVRFRVIGTLQENPELLEQ